MRIRDKMQINENQLRIAGLFTNGFDRSYYVREVGKILSISPRTAQLNLEQLERLRVLASKLQGKIKLYVLRRNEITKEYLKLAEMFKLIRFFEGNELIREVISKIDPYIEGLGLIFGSYVKGTQKQGSDLDIFVAGKCDKHRVREISNRYGLNVSIKNYLLNVFKRDFRKDILAKEVIKNHIVFRGVEQFVKIVMNDG